MCNRVAISGHLYANLDEIIDSAGLPNTAYTKNNRKEKTRMSKQENETLQAAQEVYEYVEANLFECALVCEQSGDRYRIRNTIDNTVLYSEDETGKLKDHVGHSLEAAVYGEDACACIECVDCYEVLYSTDANE